MRRAWAGVRYVWAILIGTQKWAPPAIVLTIGVVWVWAIPPVNLDTVKVVLLVLFALAAWLGFAVATAEDVTQRQISISQWGSARPMLVVEWGLATGLAVLFPVAMLVGYYTVGRLTGVRFFTGIAAVAAGSALLVSAASAAAIGVMAARYLRGRPGWAGVGILLVSLTQAIGWVPPVGWLSAALVGTRTVDLAGLGWGLLVGAAITAVALRIGLGDGLGSPSRAEVGERSQ